jgi:nucleotide-binding universal stress UspA family protein
MISIQKILCPTDFSEPSYEGVKVANEIALKFSAEIILIHFVSPIPVLAMPGEPAAAAIDVKAYQDEMIAQAKGDIQSVADANISEALSVQTFVGSGSAADEIVRFAEKEKVSLIVMATHGHTGWRRLILGSVTEKVIRNSQCYVFSVPAPAETDL